MAFHLYDINELYSNADGSIQFIELKVGNFNSENFWQGHTITVTQGATTHSFTFPSNLPSNTANTSALIATQGFADLEIVAPNYIVPSGFLFIDGGTVNFASADIVAYAALPTDGTLSINRSGVSGVNSPTNFAGTTGTVPAPAPANHPPTLLNALADQTATEDTAFSFTVPANAFADVDAGDTLSYSATKADGTALPAWLTFSASNRIFSGTPVASDAGTIDIKVTATDAGNASATDVFALTVPGDSTYTLSGKTYFWNKVAARDTIAAGHVLMDGVTVSANDGGTAREGTTAAGGAYSVASIAASTAALTASQTVSTADETTVTLGDALEVLKLYLGKLASPSPYQYLAADFNADNKVTLADALGILKSVLNKTGALEPAWVFVDEEANLSALTKDSAARPTIDDHPVASDPSLNLVAVLRGDANGSWKPAATASYEVLADSYFTELVGLHADYMSTGQFGL